MSNASLTSKVAAPAAGGVSARAVIFAIVLLLPVALLAWVFYDVSTTGGIKKLPDGTTFVELQAMSTFSFDQEDGTIEDVPEKYRLLDGERVVLEGEMYSDAVPGGDIESFDLVYSIADCCLVAEPQVQHFVRSQTVNGPVRLRQGEVRVIGTLRVDVERDDTGVTGVYHLAVEGVEAI
ncbi:MAG: hypothetical protein AAGI46_14600 [Planctomycetota bacterium]